MKDLFAENFENFWKNVVCERFWELLFSENTLSTPPPVANIFRKAKGGPGMEGGPNTPPPPPTRNRLARPWFRLLWSRIWMFQAKWGTLTLPPNRMYSTPVPQPPPLSPTSLGFSTYFLRTFLKEWFFIKVHMT